MAISVPGDRGPVLAVMLAIVNATLFVRNRAMQVDLTQMHWEIASPLITIHPSGYNPSGFNGALVDIALNLEAEVVSGQPVPELSTVSGPIG